MDKRFKIEFIDWFKTTSSIVHNNAIKKGWWEEERNNGELIALMHSELSEALEALRKNAVDDKLPQYKGVEVELADCIIRIMDTAQARGWRVAEAIVDKIEYNKGRGYKHGKLF